MHYIHSVKLDKDLCRGCVTCIKFCPTEAIRIRKGKAFINGDRCIDCGECIRTCSYHAKSGSASLLSDIKKYKYNVALPSLSLFGQFDSSISIKKIFVGLKKIGFDAVYDVAEIAEQTALEVESYIKTTEGLKKPMISGLCPSVIRLIKVKFPALIENITPILSYEQVAATEARKEYIEKTGLPSEDIGIWLISSCPAKVTNVKQPVDVIHTDFSGALSVSEIYGKMSKILNGFGENDDVDINSTHSSSFGYGLGYAGGEIRAAGIVNSLVVDGISNVADILEQIEMNKLYDVDYVECWACPGGCVGGSLNAEDRFVAEKNLKLRVRSLRDKEPLDRKETIMLEKKIIKTNSKERFPEIHPRPIMKLDEDVAVAMKKFVKMKEIASKLPGVDCGACGSPSCLSLAEDIVRGVATDAACIFKLRRLVNKLEYEKRTMSIEENKDKGKEGDISDS